MHFYCTLILMAWLFCFHKTGVENSIFWSVLAGFLLNVMVGISHNFLHQPSNFWQHLINLSSFPHDDWVVSHSKRTSIIYLFQTIFFFFYRSFPSYFCKSRNRPWNINFWTLYLFSNLIERKLSYSSFDPIYSLFIDTSISVHKNYLSNTHFKNVKKKKPYLNW
jgi:hypothetical protein